MRPAASRSAPSRHAALRAFGGAAVLAAAVLLAATPEPRDATPASFPATLRALVDTTERDTTRRDTARPDTARRDTTERDTAQSDAVPEQAARPEAGLPGEAPVQRPVRRDTLAGDSTATGSAEADTLRSAPLATDTLATDTLAADTLTVDTLRRVQRYAPARGGALFPTRPSRGRTAELLPQRSSFWAGGIPGGERYRHRLALDTTGRAITAREEVGDETLAPPLRTSRDAYRQARRRRDTRANWLALRDQNRRRRTAERRGLGVSVAVPGGRESAFTTIFGKSEVSLSINGQADIDAGLNYRRSDQQAALTGDPTQIDPAFKQDLRLGITGSIGDKMQVDVNWDTQSQFDYQNQVKLRYTGYEDEIIQRVEAGNVFLDTPSRLIDGGQSLFGIRSEFQLGGLSLTTVASQQEGQSNSLRIEGGSERTEYNFSALRYDDRKHFFLGYFFRNNWNRAHRDPQALLTNFAGFDRITQIQVWRTQTGTGADTQPEDVTALVDLGESSSILALADAYTDSVALPRPEIDQYDPSFLQRLRAGERSALAALEPDSAQIGAVQTRTQFDYYEGDFVRLDDNEYNYDDELGYLSLRQRLRDNEALAVAFRYQTTDGQTRQVGDFEDEGGDGQLVLKLLRPEGLIAPDDGQQTAAWFLQLRNIYELRGRNFDRNGFELDVQYDPPGGTARSRLPALEGQRTLLQQLGLDRLDTEGAVRPDGRFDFVNGRTLRSEDGLLIFPYLRPFGARLTEVVSENAPSGQEQTLAEEYAFERLYTSKADRLERADTKADRYQIVGSSQGSAQDFYDLRAFNGVVEGSVRVTAGGTPLSEGSDYQVDYQSGTVTIVNPSYLTTGSEINIDYEKNALVNLQKKTLLGARADYYFRDNLQVGATLMRLSQRSPADKLRIGQEPIKNTIWGVDATLTLAEPRWLTRAVDALPLVQTKAPSAVEVTAEFAQLRPGHTETQAFERTRRRLDEVGRDFTGDELAGISYIDDFEGFENSFSLKGQAQAWRLAAAPENYDPPGPAGAGDPLAANDWRGTLTWYQLNNNITRVLGDAPSYDDALKELPNVRDVFPNRDTRAQVNNNLRTLDLYFDPARRGPYNYTDDLAGFIDQSQGAWGGMTQRLPEGQKDFGVQNIEFVEFVFKPYPQGGSAAAESALYLNLGRVSEDLIPNGEENDEDGLSLDSFDDFVLSERSRLPLDGRENGAVDLEGDITEDLGLDGLASYDGAGIPPAGTEAVQFADFLENLPSGGSARLRAEVARARRDPSGDDYRFYEDGAYFADDELFPGGASFQERFAFYYPGLELNSYQAQNSLPTSLTSGRGNTRAPDAENFSSNQLTQRGNYFQYRLPLNETALQAQARPEATDDFIVGEIEDADGEGTGWYQARIPVNAPDSEIGAPDLSFVEHLRLWTSGHDAPITLRFATLELVGSQWRKSGNVTLSDTTRNTPVPGDDTGSRLTIASVNNEEDSGIYQRPRRAVVGQQQVASGGRQNTREQSLVVRAENLRKGERRAIFKNVQNLNLLKYGGLRMFAHLHSTADDFGMNAAAERGNVELFVRLGANETEDYYEYRQPLTPTVVPLGQATAEELWYPLDTAQERLANEMYLRLTALNQLKVARDADRNALLNEVFWSDRDDANSSNDVPLDPALPDFAPAGTRLGIKGTPSLQNVSTVVVGLRISDDAAREDYDDLTLWVNELRATGYDEESGWKAVANARISLADLADVNANIERQTDGWGSLASTLGERRQNRTFDWRVDGTFYLDKLLPGTSGWRIPVRVNLGSDTSTPRFAPNRGDVRLDAVLSQARAASGGADEILRDAQTHTTNRLINVSLDKQGSESPWLRYTLDNLNLVYNLSQRQSRTPSRQIDDRWQWSSNVEYSHSFERARTVRPLWFLQDAPLIGALGEVRFNYAPQSIDLYGGLSRNASAQQDRSSRLLATDEDGLPEPIRDAHAFNHERTFDLRYNPFEFMRLGFNTRTDQSFNRAGAEENYRVITDGGPVAGFDQDTPFASFEEAERYIEQNDLADDGAYVEDRLNVFGAGESFGRLFSGQGVRTRDYTQRFTASFDLPFAESEALNWIDFEDVSYQVGYGWQNSPRGSENLGARVDNRSTVLSGIALHPQQFWRKFGFYRRLEEQQEAAERNAEREDDEAPGEAEGEDEEAGPTGADAAEDGEGEDAPASRGRSFSDLPLPDPVSLLRRLVLGVTGARDFTIRYETTRRANSSNVGARVEDRFDSGSHTLLGAFRGEGPPLGYRFGFQRRIGLGLRGNSDNYTLKDVLEDSNSLEARTRLAFSENLQVSLNWGMNWQRVTTYSNLRDNETRVLTGSNSSSVWGFGGGYRAFFERQLDALPSTEAASDSVDAGSLALTNTSMSRDFRRAFASSLGTVGESGFLSLPLPAWQVTYSGLSDWPFLRALTQSVRLTHGYDAEYASDFRNVADGDGGTVRLPSRSASYLPAAFDGRRLSVRERYQPLVGLDVSWKGALRTNIEWSRTHAFYMRPASEQVTEERANELSLTADFRKQGLRIPFLPFGTLENQITFSLTASRAVANEQDFILRDALNEAIEAEAASGSYDPARALEGDNINVRDASTRLRLTPRVSYRFSNRISADFEMQYERFEGNRRPSSSTINGGFHVRVNLQE